MAPIADVLRRHDAKATCQYDAFAGYCAEAEREGIEQYPLYAWTKATIEDPAKKAKYLKSFTIYVGGEQVYPKEVADAIEAELMPLVGGGMVDSSTNTTPTPPTTRSRRRGTACRSAVRDFGLPACRRARLITFADEHLLVGRRIAMPEARKARAVGFNHIALEVGDIDEALAFYGRLFDFTLRGRSDTAAFIDLGDQFLALQKGRTQGARRRPAFRPRRRRQGSRPRGAPRRGRRDPARPVPRLSRSVGQPHRDRRLRQHPVHEGAARAARDGTGASVEERPGGQGADRERAWRPPEATRKRR